MKRMKKKPREFIPNIFTVMNMFIGFMAMGFIMRGDPIRAGWLILLACFFDGLTACFIEGLHGITSAIEMNIDVENTVFSCPG